MEINFLQVLFQAVNFGVILLVLNKFLYKPIRKVLDDREEKINAGLKAAEGNLKAADELEKTKKAEIAKARREAALLVTAAKKDARVQAEEIIKEAKAKANKEAERILDSAKQSAANSQKDVAESVKELTVATTRRLLSESLSEQEIKKITSTMVKKLKN